ncbi:hypothetical protein SAMN04489761_3432 [Tenacibaculum sp. MAR_2009_124]|uniref:hypothetical protein n=1 Tax=Tenacibaculum sp. MAR_2009_124 TaxID=1250059 RepID=UPI000897A852|nr:hypothetical protein [Tenacibaculum sp. MAR_2009_124]SEC66234.1 hypothetical protein SAMN04489761_3432 [Tenacibaculum sp. MAR_2009_124]
MDYKILEAVIKYNHPHNDYVISVAIESSPGYWKAYYKQVNEISEKSLQKVAAIGNKYSKHRALEIFESCREIENLKRHVYES